MGSRFSSPKPFIKDPAVYATKLDEGRPVVHTTKEDDTQNERTYDYVIVGGGTAACVLAHRLTEDPKVTVLMIEAGASHKGHLFTQLPATFAKTFKTKIDWGYATTDQTNAGNRSLYWPAGKLLGGGSSVNALMYQRPCEDDIHEWSKLGATGWTWEDFKGYLHKAEKYTLRPDRPNGNASQRGNAGYWFVSDPDHYPMADKFVEACEQVGIPRIDDANRPEGPIGASFVPGFIDQKGRRSSAATAYLTPPVLARQNLNIAVKTTVTKILFSTDPGAPRAIGVEIAKGPDTPRYQVRARREVLCCAGAVKTPQLLTISGIGPKEELEKLGVPVVTELEAVGKNLYDHLVATVAFRAKKGTTMDPLVTPIGGILPLVHWLATGRGPFSMLMGQAWAFVKSTNDELPFTAKNSGPSKAVDLNGPISPDLEFILAPLAYRSHGFFPAPQGENICTIGTVLLRPQSSGTITMKSASIWDGANIDPNHFAVQNDLNVFVRGVRLSLRMARSEPLVGQLLLKEDAKESEDVWFPGDADPDTVSDDALKRYIQRTSETLYHPMGTARLGLSPVDSVVDHELRVHGVLNLRVIDASVLPAPVAAHTCATVIGIAEKLADMLKEAR